MKEMIASQLLGINAVELRPDHPFTWSSGIQSPIYCDNRLLLSYPEVRTITSKCLAECIIEKFPQVEIIAGTATAGIAHSAWVSDILQLPMCYVRSAKKAYGASKQIEGRVVSGQKVVVMEDLISTGQSAITCTQVLRQAGCDVLGIVSLFTYELEIGIQKMAEAYISNYSLSNFTTLVAVAVKEGKITEEQGLVLHNWRKGQGDSSNGSI